MNATPVHDQLISVIARAITRVEIRYEDVEDVADAVLDWLGGLDGSSDGELVAHHLKTSRDEIERLRQERDQDRAEADERQRVLAIVDEEAEAVRHDGKHWASHLRSRVESGEQP